ncbi:uncharacterized protein LOC132745351 [Ruditapes philippinarum]|uniref:uncharacterized protein LOC132745351 n=1 Tax=Ruditapes philippinarum TaxID=129788 RepID=UPI00295A70F5|nr:uncharacterized protein LOC132745351 [Ruditapes philippinarum]XP_060590234.1 uncharacterized protein LOC132745351 [Ruditapes philippinarum]
MFQEPDFRESLSLMLSEVLDDIELNERRVIRGRKVNMLRETMSNLTLRSTGVNETTHYLGSHSECTTTIGLQSDFDQLFCSHQFNIIGNWSEWEHGKENYLLIQDENTTPGYCFLQLLRSDEPKPATVIPDEYNIIDRRGRIMFKNTMKTDFLQGGEEQHGPSIASQGQHGICDRDRVLAFPCKSWPQSASGWLERYGMGRWPTQKMKIYAASTPCFVVPTGSKVSVNPELEWRISTSLAERCLIFNLNITQIRCYVLMKMILKSFLNPQGQKNISSYMCKTVLLHCIENTELSIWNENNLLTCLTYCFLKLHSCVKNAHCSHFIISENNLMAGQFTADVKQELLEKISDFIQNDGQMLLGIDIDDLGCKIQAKLNIVPQRAYDFPSSRLISERLSTLEYINIANHISVNNRQILNDLHNKNIRIMKQTVERLLSYSKYGNRIEHVSCKLLTPFLFTTYGSALASSSIRDTNQMSPEALIWLSAGLNSDISSSRLKLASMFYRTGYMEKAELILRHTERPIYFYPILAVCGCWERPQPVVTVEFIKVCNEQNEDCIKHITAFCVRFIQEEINCVPRELQYEMFRSTQDDMLHRNH